MKTTQERLRESDLLWFQYVVPTLRDRFPGCWVTEIGTDRDMKAGIDYTYTEDGKELTVSARLWEEQTLSTLRSTLEENHLPGDGLRDCFPIGGHKERRRDLRSYYGGFLYSGKLWIAIIDTRRLYTAIDGMVPFLSEFYVENTGPQDRTIFKRAPFDLFEDGEIEKLILPLRTEP